ncbi:hypothetical protein F4827_004515 [Paraburkholderia bannensis]|uniref:Uncharacterized protein n=1 Tax=Paraburkholderia bannensis TaxID=765414 RepID=A0A7W9U078_9BURK|nr:MULTISPECIES: hypothetical protein [Paraburkholderia]MBB3259640.1 hypothetical protein [Paraburkholderia sp. WP4_3_2]MBB6104656.1 hypothetical protein [Paraburkholderia bannensis]
MFGMSDDAWLRFVSISYFVAASLAAIFTIVSIAAGVLQYRISNKISDDKDRALAVYQRESGEKLADANTKAAVANKSAANAQLEAANANEKAAVLANQTAHIEAENLRLKRQIAWRAIEPEQDRIIVSRLKKYAGAKLLIMSIIGDSEGLNYASQVAAEMRAAGWNVAGVNQGVFTGNPVGLVVAIHPDDRGEAAVASAAVGMVEAFVDARLMPARVIESKGDAERGTIYLIVGAKPPIARG